VCPKGLVNKKRNSCIRTVLSCHNRLTFLHRRPGETLRSQTYAAAFAKKTKGVSKQQLSTYLVVISQCPDFPTSQADDLGRPYGRKLLRRAEEGLPASGCTDGFLVLHARCGWTRVGRWLGRCLHFRAGRRRRRCTTRADRTGLVWCCLGS
jgi:hypothetical protein